MREVLKPRSCDVLVIGDEVETILSAVSAARSGAKVILARRSVSYLGGLSVRGGLSYMDITPEFVTGLFQEFLQRAGVIRVALNPEKARQALSELLAEATVTVISGVEAFIDLDSDGFPASALLKPTSGDLSSISEPLQITPKIVIDATPDADIARALGLPFIKGLGGVLGTRQNFLGVSPVFRLTGVSVEGLRDFEASLRENPRLPELLRHALPHHPPELLAEYMTRPTFAPPDMDYLDILNPVIGIDYHLWRHDGMDKVEAARSYAEAGIFIDGANISRLADGSLGFNGLIAQADFLNLGFEDLLALSAGGPIPDLLQQEMSAFERYLREKGGFSDAGVIPPDEIYVRQTVTLLSQENMTARKAILGGVSKEQAIGTFSYWLDLRGTLLWRIYSGEELPKPVFNIGLNVALPVKGSIQNFAFVSRSAGYSPIGQGAGRIVQHNAILGEAVGVAAALAVQQNRPLHEIAETCIGEIQQILADRRQGKLVLNGYAVQSAKACQKSLLLKNDEASIETLKFIVV